MSKCVCPLPWKEMSVTTSGSIRVCCTSISGSNLSRFEDGRTAKVWHSLEQGWNTALFQDLRRDMMAGKQNPICSPCYDREAKGLSSSRTDWMGFYPEWQPTTIHANLDDIRQLDIRLSNKCNLACRMCNPFSSSAWSKEWPELPNVQQLTEKEWLNLKSDWSTNPDVLSQLKQTLPHLRTIYISGGEPLLNSINQEILEYCIQQKIADQLTLRYNTNGTIWNTKTEELWRHFKRVALKFSIDGLHQLNDYIRHPSKFDKVLSNLRQAVDASSYSPLEVSINCTVQIYNIFQLPKFYEFFQEMGIPLHFDLLQEPSFLSLETLPPRVAEQAIKILEDANIAELNVFRPFLTSANAKDWPIFQAYTKKLDSLRQQNANKVLPEFYF